MARCRRCGTAFDYESREGVCPKCCFYNRPEGTVTQDDEWAKNYNIEDNSYQLPKSIIEQDEKSRKRHKYKDTERGSYYGQHRQASVGKQEERKQYARRNDERRDIEGSGKKRWIIGIVICAAVLITTAVTGGAAYFSQIKEKKTGSSRDFTITDMDLDQAKEGVAAGDTVFVVGEAKVLFKEGDLPEMPSGEKCIGIWLEADESDIDYNGIYWDRPYVYDGGNFRKMVDVNGIASSDRFEDLGDGAEVFPYYIDSYEENIESGYAVYFVDKDAKEVTLSLPCQSLDSDDDQEIRYDEVIDIRIPIEK